MPAAVVLEQLAPQLDDERQLIEQRVYLLYNTRVPLARKLFQNGHRGFSDGFTNIQKLISRQRSEVCLLRGDGRAGVFLLILGEP